MESDFLLNCMVLKKPKAYSEWNIKSDPMLFLIFLILKYKKISCTDLKKRCIIQKGSNVKIYAEAKWKASKFCNHPLVGGHICSYL